MEFSIAASCSLSAFSFVSLFSTHGRFFTLAYSHSLFFFFFFACLKPFIHAYIRAFPFP